MDPLIIQHYDTQRSFEMVMTFGILGVAVVATLIVLLAWNKNKRLKVVQEALQSGAVDAHTKRELLEGLLGTRRVPWLYRIGWFGLFVSAAMLVAGEPHWWRYQVGFSWWSGAVFGFALSLAAVTMPFAARELHARRPVASGRSES